MKTLRTQTYYPLSRGIGICFWQMWCLGPRNPVVVCFTSPLSSLTAISSPHLSCFQSPTHNLLQLAVVFKRYYQPTHNLPQLKAVFKRYYHPTAIGDPTWDQTTAQAISGTRWSLSGIWQPLATLVQRAVLWMAERGPTPRSDPGSVRSPGVLQ